MLRHALVNWPCTRSQRHGQSHVPPLPRNTHLSLATLLPLAFLLVYRCCSLFVKVWLKTMKSYFMFLTISGKNSEMGKWFCLFICEVVAEVKTNTKTVVAPNVNIYCYYFRYILTANDQLELITHQFSIQTTTLNSSCEIHHSDFVFSDLKHVLPDSLLLSIRSRQ